MITLTADHRYVDTKTGLEWPGVTSIIRVAGLMGYVPDDQWYAERGSAIHEATALYDKGILDEDTLDPQIVPYLSAWKRYRADNPNWEPDGIERLVHDPIVGYCGTIDRIGIDIKTGVHCKWHIVQAAAYWHAFTPRMLSWNTVHLRDNGNYYLGIYSAFQLNAAWRIFCAALTVAKFKQENGIK